MIFFFLIGLILALYMYINYLLEKPRNKAFCIFSLFIGIIAFIVNFILIFLISKDSYINGFYWNSEAQITYGWSAVAYSLFIYFVFGGIIVIPICVYAFLILKKSIKYLQGKNIENKEELIQNNDKKTEEKLIEDNDKKIEKKTKQSYNFKFDIKKEIRALFILFIIWFSIFAINYIRCIQLKTPILMAPTYIKALNMYEDSNGNIKSYNPRDYKGLGYKIESKVIYHTNKAVENKMYLFGVLINETSKINK